jgi:predicted permease
VRAVLLPDVFWPGPASGGRVPWLVLGLAVVAGLATGVVPALQASRPGVAAALRSGASRTHSGRGARTRGALVVLQATLAAVLLAGAGLFVRSVHRAGALDLGLDLDGVLLVNPIFEPGTDRGRAAAFYERASERLRALPLVEAASPDASPPFLGWMSVPLRVPGRDSVPRPPTGAPTIHVVEPDYFALLRLRVVRGRALDARDVLGAPRVAVVNETMARVLWPGEEPLGKCLLVGDGPRAPGGPPCVEVVGVVENARQAGLVEGAWMGYYVARAQRVVEGMPNGYLVRVRGDAATLAPAVRRALLATEPALRHAHVWPLRDLVDPQARAWRLGAAMFSVFGALALVVSAVGLYGVLAFGVAQRRLELGVRAALGATARRLVDAVLWEALRLVGAGLLFGGAIAAAAGGAVAPLLFEVSPRDPLVLGGVALALLATGAVAAWIPSWRATRVDPASALRAE